VCADDPHAPRIATIVTPPASRTARKGYVLANIASVLQPSGPLS
jgi:hypothetical protein